MTSSKNGELDARAEEALDSALAAFRATEHHKNCGQAVMQFAADLSGADRSVVEFARYLGGGLGRSGGACGVVTGAAMALGIRDHQDPARWQDNAAEGCAQLQAIIADFQREFGDVECRGLTGCDLSTEEGTARFAEEGLRESRCVGYVRWMCARLERVL